MLRTRRQQNEVYELFSWGMEKVTCFLMYPNKNWVASKDDPLAQYIIHGYTHTAPQGTLAYFISLPLVGIYHKVSLNSSYIDTWRLK